MRPPFQERFQIYVLGPNQDSRLASVAAGAVIPKIKLAIDSDSPFVLRARALRCKYTQDGTGIRQAGLQGIKTQWTGPDQDYRFQAFVPECLQQPYFGQGANWKPVSPEIVYPPSGVITIDVQNTGASAVTNLTFYWIGVKRFPWGTVPAPAYPAKMAGLTFSYPINIPALGVAETRLDQLFTSKSDADFVYRAGQGGPVFGHGDVATLAEVAIRIKDGTKFPFMNDYVQLDVLLGSGGMPRTIPIGPTPSYVAPYGTGPGSPGLFFPEFYVSRLHQFWFDVQRADTYAGATALDVNWNLTGAKVFPR